MHAVFVEKILRVQPNVKRFSLLVRASNNQAATQRFREEVHQLSTFYFSKKENECTQLHIGIQFLHVT